MEVAIQKSKVVAEYQAGSWKNEELQKRNCYLRGKINKTRSSQIMEKIITYFTDKFCFPIYNNINLTPHEIL